MKEEKALHNGKGTVKSAYSRGNLHKEEEGPTLPSMSLENVRTGERPFWALRDR